MVDNDDESFGVLPVFGGNIERRRVRPPVPDDSSGNDSDSRFFHSGCWFKCEGSHSIPRGDVGFDVEMNPNSKLWDTRKAR
jgi:hypothetical protein